MPVGGDVGADQALPSIHEDEEHPVVRDAASGLGVPGVIQAVVAEVKGLPPTLGAAAGGDGGGGAGSVAVTVAMTLLPWRSASATQAWATLGKGGNRTWRQRVCAAHGALGVRTACNRGCGGCCGYGIRCGECESGSEKGGLDLMEWGMGPALQPPQG